MNKKKRKNANNETAARKGSEMQKRQKELGDFTGNKDEVSKECRSLYQAEQCCDRCLCTCQVAQTKMQIFNIVRERAGQSKQIAGIVKVKEHGVVSAAMKAENAPLKCQIRARIQVMTDFAACSKK